MINVKPILFFDDGKEESTGKFRIHYLIEACENFSLDIGFYTTLEEHFDFLDGSGNDIEILFDKDAIAYVFVHHSFNAPSMIPSNYFDLLRDKLGSKLVVFSGETTNSLKEGRFRRGDIYSNLKEFLDLQKILEEYRLEIFVERNYNKLLLEDYFETFREQLEDGKEIAFNSSSFFKLAYLLNIDKAKLINRLCEKEEEGIIAFLENKIETL